MNRSKVPRFFRMFKSKGPDQFTYFPKYYDEAKERREKVKREEIQRLQKKNNQEAQASVARQNMQDAWARNRRAQANKSANFRVVIILVILSLICYQFIKNLDKFL